MTEIGVAFLVFIVHELSSASAQIMGTDTKKYSHLRTNNDDDGGLQLIWLLQIVDKVHCLCLLVANELPARWYRRRRQFGALLYLKMASNWVSLISDSLVPLAKKNVHIFRNTRTHTPLPITNCTLPILLITLISFRLQAFFFSFRFNEMRHLGMIQIQIGWKRDTF